MEDSNESQRSPSRGLLSGLNRFLNPPDDTENSDEQQSSQTYGSTESSNNFCSAALDVSVGANLGNILEDEEMKYSEIYNKVDGDDDEDHDDDDSLSMDSDELDFKINGLAKTAGGNSFHLGLSHNMSLTNIMVTERTTASFLEHGEEYQLVPTKLENNVRMVEDINLWDGTRGRLYLASYSFFENRNSLKYALTVQPDIYQRVINEVNNAYNVPCGLYFCCHGGDGAHTGVSHNDYVDIRLAWFIFLFVIGCLLAVEFFVDGEF
mmetsp:Transcript_24637/g.52530  ORF Transcript_24637/g.52530 Transcript_24637/m.52530 type:complete len:265 (+) Transcript_24637:69-863(+)|eukprot:CAMPEP_0201125470 /NCGR_PEP_ID=MMETSP0850-20130426/21604_1 /ASSEMBLY_ACC=CAM_ASM_000622 /TAXON_ID=183588 /ORGANISM="Pseudo-nitzschia fraudulenta, Strain WWA7" /LENGTH=264 /DNA_ID=CAMNT_0047393519 /DNA_START=210 /DNA_END=1004 /DNA_ORIENTATION=-